VQVSAEEAGLNVHMTGRPPVPRRSSTTGPFALGVVANGMSRASRARAAASGPLTAILSVRLPLGAGGVRLE
jgi:hypothetical protein